MTIDLRRLALILPVVILCWLILLAGVMRATGQAPSALVLLPPAGFAGALPPGVSVLSAGPFSLTVRADMPDLVARLYAAGAVLVLPAGLTGCLPQRQP